jgi:hypothetical protein
MLTYYNSYYIGDHFLAAIANADFTGLDDLEEALLEAWFPGPGFHLSITDDTTEFTRCSITGLYGSCTKVDVYEHINVTSQGSADDETNHTQPLA